MKKVWIYLLTLLFSFSASAFDEFYQMEWLEKGSFIDQSLTNRQLLEDVYRARDFQVIWYHPESTRQFENQLALLHYSQLSPYFSRRFQQLCLLRQEHMFFAYDLLATDTLISYIAYAKSAASRAQEWYFNGSVIQDINNFTEEDLDQLQLALDYETLTQYISGYAPPDFDLYFIALTELLGRMEKFESLPLYAHKGLKRKGDSLAYKAELLIRLDIVGLQSPDVDLSSDIYGPELEKLVKIFQKLHGIKIDGIIGPDTISWLNFPASERVRTLALNAERFRMLPKNRDSLIVVNVPNFNIAYWHDGKPVFVSKVIVGQEERKTPLINTRLYSMIVNPSWNVPKKLFYEDLLPKIKRDLTYLERNHFKVLQGGYFGEEIDPATIEWSKYSKNTYFPYQLRQDSGNKNALGRYKFDTPNDQAIYLHDTPSKYLFSNHSRAFSSGCIRVQFADKFAQVLLKSQGIESDLDQMLQSEEKVRISMKRSIPVTIIYQTAWYQSGYINYRKDIYDYDKINNELINKDDKDLIALLNQ